MLSPLSRAVLRGPLRVAHHAAGRMPVLALVVGGLALSSPVLAYLGGSSWGDQIGPAFDVPSFALTMGAALFTAGCMLGVCASTVAPRVEAFDGQLLTAPVSRRRFVLDALVLPSVLPMLAILLVAACLVVPLTRASPGGGMTAAALLLLGGWGVAVGMSAVSLVRAGPSLVSVLSLLFLASLWLLAGTADASLVVGGPVTAAAGAAGGDGSSLWLLAGAGLPAMGTAAVLWLVTAVRVPGGAGRRAVPRWHGRADRTDRHRGGLFRSTVRGLWRRRDLRNNILAVQVLVPVTASFSAGFAVLPELMVYFVLLLATVGGATTVLALPQHYAEGRWLVLTSPRGEVRCLAAVLAAGLLIYLATVAVALVAPLLLGTVPVDAVASVAGTALVVAAVALLAGALVPWSRSNVTQQAVSGLAFLALLVLVYLTASQTASWLVDAGAATPVALTAVVVLACTVAVGAAGWTMSRRVVRSSPA